MIVVIGHYSALQGYTGSGTTWAEEMNFVMNHAPDAGSIDDIFMQDTTCTDRVTVMSNIERYT